jgi:hypothetical protein
VALALAGRSQSEIAQAVGVSQSAVSQILRRVDERWVREHVDRLNRYIGEQLRQLDHLYREAIRAWEASKGPRTRRRQRQSDQSAASGGGAVAEITVEESAGDPRYLEIARRIQADRLQLLERLAAAAAAVQADAPEEVTFTFNIDHPSGRPFPRGRPSWPGDVVEPRQDEDESRGR